MPNSPFVILTFCHVQLGWACYGSRVYPVSIVQLGGDGKHCQLHPRPCHGSRHPRLETLQRKPRQCGHSNSCFFRWLPWCWLVIRTTDIFIFFWYILIIGDYESGVDLILHLGDLTTLGLLSWMASLLWQDLDKVSKTIVFEYRQTIGTWFKWIWISFSTEPFIQGFLTCTPLTSSQAR